MDNGKPPIHVVAMGDPGAGKSSFAKTFPKPMVVCFFDALGKDTPYMRGAKEWRDEPDAKTHRRTVIHDDGEIQIRYYNDLDPLISREGKETPAWERFDTFTKALCRKGGVGPTQTVVIDSTTYMELCARKYQELIVNPTSKEPRRWFAGSTDQLESILMMRFSALSCNLVVTCHIDEDRDEVNGMMLRNPTAPGRLKKRLPAAFGEFYRVYTYPDDEGRQIFALQTRSDTRFNASSQIDAPNPAWADYNSLWPVEE